MSGTGLTLHDGNMHMQINDRYDFPDELDLDLEDGKWLSENADRSVRNLYKLHSVLVHSGGVHGGHYYAYIQPDRKRWLKFDDERVRPFSSFRPLVCMAHTHTWLWRRSAALRAL